MTSARALLLARDASCLARPGLGPDEELALASGRRIRSRRTTSSSRRMRFKTLANGLQVIAVSHHEQPAVSLRLLVRAGSAQDPENRPGVASLAATLLDQGTTTPVGGADRQRDRLDRRRAGHRRRAPT